MSKKPTGLYIHVPYCVQKCPYCDFYSGKLSRQDEYIQSAVRNIQRYTHQNQDLIFDTVYFGGGTPSLLPEISSAVLSEIRLTPNAEITFEANPETVTPSTFETLLKSGVNRLSFGVQSLTGKELSALGRIHSAEKAIQAITTAHNAGFSNISADIMLGIPYQTKETLIATIDKLASLPITHVSAYMLKIEPNTPFGKRPPSVPDEDEQAELYLLAVSELEKHGFKQYEISNFAKADCESRHNLKYWRCEEYIGIGPAAHSYYNGKRYAVPRDLGLFIDSEQQCEEFTDESPDTKEEQIMLGLRLCEGIPITEELQKRLKLIPPHLIRAENNRISLTPEGFLVSNEIISLLI